MSVQALRIGGGLDPVLEMAEQPHSINWPCAAITCERPRLCLLLTQDLEIASHGKPRRHTCAVHNLVEAGHTCVSGLEVGRVAGVGDLGLGVGSSDLQSSLPFAHTYQPNLSKVSLCLRGPSGLRPGAACG